MLVFQPCPSQRRDTAWEMWVIGWEEQVLAHLEAEQDEIGIPEIYITGVKGVSEAANSCPSMLMSHESIKHLLAKPAA